MYYVQGCTCRVCGGTCGGYTEALDSLELWLQAAVRCWAMGDGCWDLGSGPLEEQQVFS